MSIRYALFANRLRVGVAEYTARVQSQGTVGLDALVERVVGQGSHLSRGDALAVMEGEATTAELTLTASAWGTRMTGKEPVMVTGWCL